jgi:hypothetical protein
MAIVAAMFYGLATFTQNINPVDPGPAFYPRIVSALLFAAASIHVAVAWRAVRAGSGERGLGEVGGNEPESRYALRTRCSERCVRGPASPVFLTSSAR